MEKTKPALKNDQLAKEVSKVLNTLLRSQEEGDVETFAHCFLHEQTVVHIGTDTDEYFTSWKDYFHQMDDVIPSREGTEINEKNTRVYFNSHGDTSWYSQLIDTCYETKGEITRIEGFRHTGVLVSTPGGWKIVQSHVSAPINAEGGRL